MTANEKYINEVMQGFQFNRGKGSVYCLKPFNPFQLVVACIASYSNKHPNEQVFIVISEYSYRKDIIDTINNIYPNNSFDYKIISADYIKPQYHYMYSYTIILGNINSNTVLKLAEESKFTLCIFTEHIVNQNVVNRIRNVLKDIPVSVNKSDVQRELIYSPVEEHWHSVTLSDEDKQHYDKCTEYINTTISIFENLQNIEYAKKGNPAANISSSEFRWNLAVKNGWSDTLDMSVEYNRQIDEIYNPNALFEKAVTFFNISAERRNILLNNSNKIAVIKEIYSTNRDKKILILSKNGEFAKQIASELNTEYGDICGEYHDCIDDMVAVDIYGNPILWQSGANKGKPKIIKSKAISSQYERMFNSGRINVLSAKFSSDSKLKIAVDIVIFTDGSSSTIVEVRNRFSDIKFANNLITYRLFTENTIEEKKMYELNMPANIHVIKDFEENYTFS